MNIEAEVPKFPQKTQVLLAEVAPDWSRGPPL